MVCLEMGYTSNIHPIIEGSLEAKLPTIWTDEKRSRAEAERRERLEERRSEKRKSQKKEDADARKGREVEKHCVFPMICGSGGSKSRLAKAAGAEPAGQMREEKLHAVVARSTFRSQNVQNTPLSDHFWKLRCRKSARRCGAKHISKSKCTKHHGFGPLLEVAMSKKCTPLWREVYFEVKMYKTHHARTTFGGSDVEKVYAVVARSTFRSQNVQKKHHMFAPLLEVRMLKKCTLLWREAHFQVKMLKAPGVRTTFGGSDVASLHYTTLHYTTLHYTTLHYTTLHYTTLQLQLHNYTPLHSTTLNYATLHYIALHYTTLHYTTLHYLPLHFTKLHYTPLHYNYNYTPLHSTTLNYTTLHYTTLHYTTLHYITLHYLPLHFTTLHYTPLHYNYDYDYTTTLHYTKLHYTTLHYTTLHYIPLHSTTLHYITLH